jgi:hypothetical protein
MFAESRFSRPVIRVADPKEYGFYKLDDNNFPFVKRADSSISCIVYRGAKRYYVEVGILNLSKNDVTIPNDLISFIKPKYTVLRTSTVAAAQDVALASGGTFAPMPPPQVPPQTITTYSATASTYGNQTYLSGTANTTSDTSAQAGANLGNAIGNAIAARRFYKAQARESKFSNFLYSFAQENQDSVIKPGEARIIVATFEQVKNKKAPFEIHIGLNGETVVFKYKE